jgi:hypothetical protein
MDAKQKTKKNLTQRRKDTKTLRGRESGNSREKAQKTQNEGRRRRKVRRVYSNAARSCSAAKKHLRGAQSIVHQEGNLVARLQSYLPQLEGDKTRLFRQSLEC